MTFGEKLQTLRAREGLSQDSLAELLNVSRQAVSRWERDETMPETEKVVRISDHFGVTTDYLLKDGPEQFPPASRPLPDPGELWNKYGFVLGWLLAVWGCLWACACLSETFQGTYVKIYDILFFLNFGMRGLSAAAAGALLALRWRKAGRFRRQDLGWALTLGSGLCILSYLLSVLIDWGTGAFTIIYRFLPLWGFSIPLILGLLLALFPSRKEKAK